VATIRSSKRLHQAAKLGFKKMSHFEIFPTLLVTWGYDENRVKRGAYGQSLRDGPVDGPRSLMVGNPYLNPEMINAPILTSWKRIRRAPPGEITGSSFGAAIEIWQRSQARPAAAVSATLFQWAGTKRLAGLSSTLSCVPLGRTPPHCVKWSQRLKRSSPRGLDPLPGSFALVL
jgi:hypothetical protein